VWELADPSEAVSDSESFGDEESRDDGNAVDHNIVEPLREPKRETLTLAESRKVSSAVMTSIRACKDGKKRLRSEAFELLPARRVFPAYYRAISNPIDLGSIQRCHNSGGYPTLWKFLVALELMLSNCQNFNEPSSVLYKDAEVLRKVIAGTVNELIPGHPLPKRDSCYDAKKSEEPIWKRRLETPSQSAGASKRPVLKFTMKKPTEPFKPPPPCANCEMCDKHKPQECFEIALLKAVHEKKPGADLANRRSNLRGTTLEVYWPDDDTWYRGRVVKYNAMRREHTLTYAEDGSRETLQLWADSCSCRPLAR